MISYNEAWDLVRALLARLTSGHLVWLDFEALNTYEPENDVCMTGMHNTLIGWDEDVLIDETVGDASKVATEERLFATLLN